MKRHEITYWDLREADPAAVRRLAAWLGVAGAARFGGDLLARVTSDAMALLDREPAGTMPRGAKPRAELTKAEKVDVLAPPPGWTRWAWNRGQRRCARSVHPMAHEDGPRCSAPSRCGAAALVLPARGVTCQRGSGAKKRQRQREIAGTRRRAAWRTRRSRRRSSSSTSTVTSSTSWPAKGGPSLSSGG